MADIALFIKYLPTLLKCLPVILGLFQSIEKGIDDAKLESEVKDQMVKVKDAIDKRDSAALDSLFNK